MISQKKKIALAYRIIIIVITAIALFLNFKLLTFKTGILYFTNISNLLCLIYFIILVILMILNKEKNDKWHYIIKGMITMSITLTMFVYNFILVGEKGVFENHMLECNLVHVVVPLLVIFDYIIFGEKGHLKKSYPFIWTGILFLYQIFITIYTMLGGTFANGARYPYFYMDVARYGIIGVVINTLIVLLLYIIYGVLVQIIDNKWGIFFNEECKELEC